MWRDKHIVLKFGHTLAFKRYFHFWNLVVKPIPQKQTKKTNKNKQLKKKQCLNIVDTDVLHAQSFSLLSKKSWILLIFSSCWSRRSSMTPMGVFFRPTPSILFSNLFFMLRSLREAWIRITEGAKNKTSTESWATIPLLMNRNWTHGNILHAMRLYTQQSQQRKTTTLHLTLFLPVVFPSV